MNPLNPLIYNPFDAGGPWPFTKEAIERIGPHSHGIYGLYRRGLLGRKHWIYVNYGELQEDLLKIMKCDPPFGSVVLSQNPTHFDGRGTDPSEDVEKTVKDLITAYRPSWGLSDEDFVRIRKTSQADHRETKQFLRRIRKASQAHPHA